MKKAVTIGLICIAGAILIGCAQQPTPYGAGHPGFWYGLLHGAISPFALIASAFMDDVRIYAYHNNGGWYDFGFVIGCSLIFGGSGSQAHS